MTGWVFAAERACISANIAYQRLASRIKSPGIDWQAFRDVGELMQRTGTRLRDLDVPRGAPDSFHGDVVVRLRTMNALGDAAVDLADAFLASDRLGVGTAADRVETLQESGDRLATGFREYHVLACAGLIGGRLGDDNPVKT
jgi:hypothetical protein